MQIFSEILCLFLFLSSIYTVESKFNIEETIDTWVKTVESLPQEKVSDFSKKVSDQYRELYQCQQEDLQKLDCVQKKAHSLQRSLKRLNDQLLRLKIESQSWMIRDQRGFDNLWTWIDHQYLWCLLEKKQEDLQFELNRQTCQSRKNDIEVQHLSNRIYQQEQILQQLQKIQNRIFIKYHQHFDHFQEGTFNQFPDVIQGKDDLPHYGQITAFKPKQKYTCLIEDHLQIDTFSSEWMFPIVGGTMGEGTWNYSHGGLHLGLDLVSPMFSEVIAPCNGIILFRQADEDSNNGYLGNMCGWPYGGGNTICMIGAIHDRYYAISFAHLSNTIDVYPGQQVQQGQRLALTGNSGNSTGPHTHIEIFELKESLESCISYFKDTADFSFGCGYEQAATCSNYACRMRPEEYITP